MLDISKKKGRTRTLSDEERAENKRKKDARIIKFSAPDGFKEIFQLFVSSKKAKDIGTILVPMIKNNDEFKKFKTSLINKP